MASNVAIDCEDSTLDDHQNLDEENIRSIAERAMTRRVGVRTILSNVQNAGGGSARNTTLRAQATSTRDTRSVIVKATRSPDYASNPHDGFARFGLIKEWTARELLNRIGGSHRSAALIAGDAENGVIVFQDHGQEIPSLSKSLLHGSAHEAELALVAYATSIGRLHAETIGCQQAHAEVLKSEFPASFPPTVRGITQWWPDPLPAIGNSSLPTDEIELVRARMDGAGPWTALVHGDGCPDNVLIGGGQAWLLDFEFAAPGHMLLDAVYWRMGFPTCWCAGTLPEAVIGRLDAAYRHALADAFPMIADEPPFRREIAVVMLARLLLALRWLLESALREDTVWGIATRRNRILWYLESSISACRDASAFSNTQKVLSLWLANLRELWPACESLAPYPAFSPAEINPN